MGVCWLLSVWNWLQRGVLHRNRPSASKQINHKEVLGVTNNQQPHTSWSGNTHFFLITAYYQVSLHTIIDWGPNQPIIKVLKFYGQNWNPWKRNAGKLILYQVQSRVSVKQLHSHTWLVCSPPCYLALRKRDYKCDEYKNGGKKLIFIHDSSK